MSQSKGLSVGAVFVLALLAISEAPEHAVKAAKRQINKLPFKVRAIIGLRIIFGKMR